MPVKLYVIRHGETEWSLSGQHTGRTDIPLTPRGEEEARRLAPWLSGIRFSAALCSPRQRAQRTCELAGLGAARAGGPGLGSERRGHASLPGSARSVGLSRTSLSGTMAITRACAPLRSSRNDPGGTFL